MAEGLEAEAPGGSSPAVRPPVRGVDQCDDPAGTGQPLFRLPTALHQAAQPPSPDHQVCKSKGREKAGPGRPTLPAVGPPHDPQHSTTGGCHTGPQESRRESLLTGWPGVQLKSRVPVPKAGVRGVWDAPGSLAALCVGVLQGGHWAMTRATRYHSATNHQRWGHFLHQTSKCSWDTCWTSYGGARAQPG